MKTAKQRIDQINKKTISIQWKINATERELKQIDQTQLTDPAQQVRNDYVDRLLQNIDVTSKEYKAHRKEYDSIRTDANNIKAYAQTRGQDAVRRKAHLQEKQADLTQQLTELNHQHQQATEELKNLQHELGTRPPQIVGDVTTTRLRETQSQVVALKEQLHQAITEHEAILTEMNKHASDFQDERQFVELRKSAREHATSHQDDLSRSIANYTLAHVDTNLRDITNRRLALNQRHFDAERNVNKLRAQLQKSERELTLLKQKAAEIQLPGLQETQKTDGEVQHYSTLQDLHQRHYEAHRHLDTVTRQFNEQERKLRFYQEQKLTLPDVRMVPTTYGKYTRFSVHLEKLYEIRSDLLEAQNSYSRATDVLSNQHKICRQSLDTFQTAIDQIDATGNAVDNGNVQKVRADLVKLQEDTKKTYTLLDERWRFAYEKYNQVKQRIEDFDKKDITETKERVEAFRKELGEFQDHPFFPWYERSEYASEAEGRQSLSSGIRNGCVVSAMMTRMSDYPKSAQFNSTKIKAKDMQPTHLGFLRLDLEREHAETLLRCLQTTGARGSVIKAVYRQPKIVLSEAQLLAEKALQPLQATYYPTYQFESPVLYMEYPMYWTFISVSEQLMQEGHIPGGILVDVDKIDGHIWQEDEV